MTGVVVATILNLNLYLIDCHAIIAFLAKDTERKSRGEGCPPVQQEGCLYGPRGNPTKKKRKVG